MEDFNQMALTWDEEPRRSERARLAALEILSAIPAFNRMSGLEYGCGTGLLSFNLQPYLKEITLADSSKGMLAVLNQKILQNHISNMFPIRLDLETDGSLADKYDLIYTLMTMHHILDVDKVIQAFYEMLNPEGYIFIADLDEEDGSFHGVDFVGHNGFNQTELIEKLKAAGFSNVKSHIFYENPKTFEDGSVKTYPVFFMSGQKK